MVRRYDVLVAGELNVDLILNRLQKFPEMGKEVIAEGMTLTLGSSSAIFASNLSVLGTSVTFAGALARDSFGDLILASLRAKGVATDDIVFTDTCSTGASVALNVGEDRAMVTYPGAMSLFSLDHIPNHLFEKCRHLHVSSIFLSTALKRDVYRLFKVAKDHGMTTSLDPQWDPYEQWAIDFPELLRDVDVFLPNESEICAITGMTDPDAAAEELRKFANVLVVKHGRKGASLWHGDRHLFQPAFLNNNVVDSIGAGDSFDAGFIHGFIQGKDLANSLEFAAVTGAVNTTRAGGTTAFGSLDEVRAIARDEFNFEF